MILRCICGLAGENTFYEGSSIGELTKAQEFEQKSLGNAPE